MTRIGITKIMRALRPDNTTTSRQTKHIISDLLPISMFCFVVVSLRKRPLITRQPQPKKMTENPKLMIHLSDVSFWLCAIFKGRYSELRSHTHTHVLALSCSDTLPAAIIERVLQGLQGRGPWELFVASAALHALR